MTKAIILVGIGGAVGSILRYVNSLLVAKYFQTQFPLATFMVNILGCLIIGILMGVLDKQNVASPELRLLFITGFCGGFTTFSTFSSENISLLQSGQTLTAILYITASVILGLLAVWAGMSIVGKSII